ncbi:hypothetical protein [Perlucidibaca piscinae]|uniref:hypothetical protein n=1 Tax=Perlucidibaca piscinae TaxID=392589 RepID=UPI000A01D5F6|nr:hypothetical protein [Perlucidibaca piscinae]
MSIFYYKDIPESRLKGFRPVRSALDNLSNILEIVELVNTCGHHMTTLHQENFDFVIFTGDHCRALVKKPDGFFTMAIPFQAINDGEILRFNCDEVGEEVSGKLLSILKNAISTSKIQISHEDIIFSFCESFDLEVHEAIYYYDAFASLLSEDHGYFRFDDDEINQNGKIHPRFHFDFFFKNSSSVKIGIERPVDINFFHSLFNRTQDRYFLAK